MRGAVTTGLIVGTVLLVALAILSFVYLETESFDRRSGDIGNMRQLYTASMLYADLNDHLPPPSLDLVRNEIGNTASYLASGDPFTEGSTFPIDPAFPNLEPAINFRISFTYMPQWAAHKRIQVKDLREVLEESSVGLLACYWYDLPAKVRPDGLNAQGDIVRINTDGSAKTIKPEGTRSKLLDATLLFGIKSNVPK